MFIRKPPTEKSALDVVIDDTLEIMGQYAPYSDEYIEIVTQLEKLYALKNNSSTKRVTPDTWVLVGGNLAGIFAILTYEQGRVITTKALSFVMKASR